MVVTASARERFGIVFKRRVTTCDIFDCVDRLVGQNASAEVCVEDDPRCVDDAFERRLEVGEGACACIVGYCANVDFAQRIG